MEVFRGISEAPRGKSGVLPEEEAEQGVKSFPKPLSLD